METQSIVLKRLYIIWSYLSLTFKDSVLYVILKKVTHFFRFIFKTSVLLEIVKKETIVSKVWESSRIYRFIDGVPHALTKTARNLYEKRRNIFSESRIYKLILLAADNIHILLSLAFIVMLITPHSFWYNIFSALIAFGLLVLFYFKAVADKNTNFNFKFICFYLAVFMLSILFSQIFSLFPSLSLRFLIFHLTCFVMVFILVNCVNTKERLSTVIESLLVGLTFVGLYAIAQFIKGVPVNAAQTDLSVNAGMPGRVYATMENPNNLGQVLILLLPFYIGVVAGSKSFIKRFIVIGMGIPPLIALALTYSRSSWIGFAVAAFMFVLLINWRYIPLFILAGVAMVPFLPTTVYNRILTIFTGDSSVSYRFLIYRTIWPVLEKYWFSGTGLGSDVFMKVVQNYPLHTKVVPPHTHNLFIQVWIETGLIGILSFIGFLGSLIKRGVNAIKPVNAANEKSTKGDMYIKYTIISGVASLVGILVVGLAEYVWYYPRVMVIFWVVIGLLLTALNLQKSEEIAAKQERAN